MIAAADARLQPALLSELIPCPQCGRRVDFTGTPSCTTCEWKGRLAGEIADFVDDAQLHDAHRAEMAAQAQAVEAYYENDSKLCSHWDQISAVRLPGLLGWPRGRVLDLGCGTGTAGEVFEQSGAQVVGADLSLSCLAVAKRRLSAVVRADASALPFGDEVFDAVVARGALHHLPDVQGALSEIRRVMKPGAPALFLDPRAFAWLEPIKDALRARDESFSDDHRAYRPEEYRDLIGQFLNVEEELAQYPFGILLAAGLDLLPLPESLPHRRVANALFRTDELLNRTPLKRQGHLLVIRARKS